MRANLQPRRLVTIVQWQSSPAYVRPYDEQLRQHQSLEVSPYRHFSSSYLAQSPRRAGAATALSEEFCRPGRSGRTSLAPCDCKIGVVFVCQDWGSGQLTQMRGAARMIGVRMCHDDQLDIPEGQTIAGECPGNLALGTGIRMISASGIGM